MALRLGELSGATIGHPLRDLGSGHGRRSPVIDEPMQSLTWNPASAIDLDAAQVAAGDQLIHFGPRQPEHFSGLGNSIQEPLLRHFILLRCAINAVDIYSQDCIMVDVDTSTTQMDIQEVI